MSQVRFNTAPVRDAFIAYASDAPLVLNVKRSADAKSFKSRYTQLAWMAYQEGYRQALRDTGKQR